MKFVGIDLHKKTIAICVVNQERKVLERKSLQCANTDEIVAFFKGLGVFRATVEATGSYEWLWLLLEPLAERLVLAHPKKLRIIAESTRKNDKLDAQVLAEFLALDMIPEAYRPTPRQRQHRVLVRHRCFLRQRSTCLKNKMRRILADYNADRKDLFSEEGLKYLAEVKLSAADRFVLEDLRESWEHHEKQIVALDKELKAFAKKGSVAEKESRAILESTPAVGTVTVDVVLSELGDIRRFSSVKKVVSYAGLAPGQRESAGKSKSLGITKEGSRLLRWALVEAAWRLVRQSMRWKIIFNGLVKRSGRKKGIVAVARRLLVTMASMLRSGQKYRLVT
jgi:transposase